ncbi:MAG: hypothetical protein JXA33_16115 [Anaerolineae bacterium]|nr:hypothetical protein [Anaerolineae bacterium]
MNNNQLPQGFALLVLDTEREPTFTVSGWGKERGHYATGPISIDAAGEYLPLTGNVKNLASAIRNEQIATNRNSETRDQQWYPHYNDWFQAQYYIDEANIDSALWNLDVGAGRFRQFGRIALFNNIQDVIGVFLTTLKAIRQMGGSQIYIHVVGSLAGGTGAAIFIDVAHLCKQLANEVGFAQSPVVFGHFVLPEGFRGTLQVQIDNPGVRQDFNARCYAALRELTRLQSPVIATTNGYPLTYDMQGIGVMNAKLTTSPYAAVYFYDGMRCNNPLNLYSIEEGIAPSIADAIMCYIDNRSDVAFLSHSVNYKSFYSAFNIPTGQVTYSTIGTYTIELPIYHITEGWAHKLALEVLNTLLTPSEYEHSDTHSLPLALDAGKPGGEARDAHSEAEYWLKTHHTLLIEQLVDWGIQAQRTSVLQRQAVDVVLTLDAAQWLQKLAPSIPNWQVYINEAQNELQSSLQDKESAKYYVDHNQPGSSSEQKADNLQIEVERKLKQMVGETVGAGQRQGGDFRKALVRLGHHHVLVFEETLMEWLTLTLNGNPLIGTPIARKQGKLGYVRAFLERIEAILQTCVRVFTLAEQDSQTKRLYIYYSIENAREELMTKMLKWTGIFNSNLKAYRNTSEELAQFYKAEIARQVVHDLGERLQHFVTQALEKVQRWEEILGTSNAAAGGAYALLLEGEREVKIDRAKAANATRWIIADDEPGDTYIAEKYRQYSRGQLEQIFDDFEWKVSRIDNSGDLQIEFEQAGAQWDRRAGNKNQRAHGLKNVALLLDRSREVYEVAWSDMSVIAYLRHNYADQIEALAKKIYKKSDLPLSFQPNELPLMRTTFVRVFKEGMDTSERGFLTRLRNAVARQFGDTITDQDHAKYLDTEDGKGDFGSGEDSSDRFKLNFVMFGDLLCPEQIAAYENAHTAYQTISSRGNAWKTLHVFPAETHALELERSLTLSPYSTRQKRRDLANEVVVALENMDAFRLMVLCLMYGETNHYWFEEEYGLLLHKYTPPRQDNPGGLSYWRLTVQPVGRHHNDGQVYTNDGRVARPEHYQLSQMRSYPDLLEAFIQFVCVGKAFRTSIEISLERVEATIDWAIAKHRQHWVKKQDLGWLPNTTTMANPKHLEESQNKAAHLIRLNALIKQADKELEEYLWAWSPKGRQTPVSFSREQQVKIQQYVDLWTVIRQVAFEEMSNLGNQLNQCGNWKANIPDEQISFNASSISEIADTDAEDRSWICSNGHKNNSNDSFCKECGESHLNTERLMVLKGSLAAGILTEEEYKIKINEIADIDAEDK